MNSPNLLDNVVMQTVSGNGAVLRKVESFLLGLDDVADASVWFHQGNICAHVCLHEANRFTEQEIIEKCANALPSTMVPQNVTVSSIRPTMRSGYAVVTSLP